MADFKAFKYPLANAELLLPRIVSSAFDAAAATALFDTIATKATLTAEAASRRREPAVAALVTAVISRAVLSTPITFAVAFSHPTRSVTPNVATVYPPSLISELTANAFGVVG
jgi:hypothetical protein